MMFELMFYNLDTKEFVAGEEALMSELNGALAHVTSHEIDNKLIVCNSTANYTEKRARDAIYESLGINTPE
jgi:hypothetical protein